MTHSSKQKQLSEGNPRKESECLRCSTGVKTKTASQQAKGDRAVDVKADPPKEATCECKCKSHGRRTMTAISHRHDLRSSSSKESLGGSEHVAFHQAVTMEMTWPQHQMTILPCIYISLPQKRLFTQHRLLIAGNP
ncbi:hypothetical protein HJG60_009508 [Phyllostomus discolor]|uniref:Uncharacterized protein n=1 Tax=Phyllostomus discolor TaxID=89673 RepID=A0A834DC55_9CHIR|nr:hypothetical protein HJG60_009508 [Phyllostomus discolor]